VKAFAELGDRRLVVAGGGPEASVARDAGLPNVGYEGEVTREAHA
jgi:hypothetical protein